MGSPSARPPPPPPPSPSATAAGHEQGVRHLLGMTRTGRLSLKDSLEVLVIDEADQVLLHGYGDDVKEIVVSLPPICQVSLSLACTKQAPVRVSRTREM